jgi:hypothetical protein
VNKHIVRSYFYLDEKTREERIQILETGERDKYNEQITSFVEMTRWINEEFKNKSKLILDLDHHYREDHQQGLGLDFLEKQSSFLLTLDSELL